MQKLLVLSILIISTLIVSCQQNSVDAIDSDAADINAIQDLIADSADVIYDAIDDESEDNMMIDDPNWLSANEASLQKTTDGKDRIFTRFARLRRHAQERTVEVVKDTDSTAVAYVHTKFTGVLVVRKMIVNNDTIIFDRFEKPLVHEVDRIVQLKKIRDTKFPRKNWRIMAVSMREGNSAEPGVDIVELVIIPSGMDSVVITDPLSYFQSRENHMSFPRMTEITLKVKVKNSVENPVVYPEGASSTETVLLHYGRSRINGRLHFARSWFDWVGRDGEGNNIYEGTWTVKQFLGFHHAVIDVINNGTIHEKDGDQYPYISSTWGSPYRVTPR